MEYIDESTEKLNSPSGHERVDKLLDQLPQPGALLLAHWPQGTKYTQDVWMGQCVGYTKINSVNKEMKIKVRFPCAPKTVKNIPLNKVYSVINNDGLSSKLNADHLQNNDENNNATLLPLSTTRERIGCTYEACV